jgi:hypothetical protein
MHLQIAVLTGLITLTTSNPALLARQSTYCHTSDGYGFCNDIFNACTGGTYNKGEYYPGGTEHPVLCRSLQCTPGAELAYVRPPLQHARALTTAETLVLDRMTFNVASVQVQPF